MSDTTGLHMNTTLLARPSGSLALDQMVQKLVSERAKVFCEALTRRRSEGMHLTFTFCTQRHFQQNQKSESIGQRRKQNVLVVTIFDCFNIPGGHR